MYFAYYLIIVAATAGATSMEDMMEHLQAEVQELRRNYQDVKQQLDFLSGIRSINNSFLSAPKWKFPVLTLKNTIVKSARLRCWYLLLNYVEKLLESIRK